MALIGRCSCITGYNEWCDIHGSPPGREPIEERIDPDLSSSTLQDFVKAADCLRKAESSVHYEEQGEDGHWYFVFKPRRKTLVMEDSKQQWMELARIGYEAYGERAGWKAYNDQPMPQWQELPEHIQEKWSAAAEVMIMTTVDRMSELLTLAMEVFRRPDFTARFKAWCEAGLPYVGVDHEASAPKEAR